MCEENREKKTENMNEKKTENMNMDNHGLLKPYMVRVKRALIDYAYSNTQKRASKTNSAAMPIATIRVSRSVPPKRRPAGAEIPGVHLPDVYKYERENDDRNYKYQDLPIEKVLELIMRALEDMGVRFDIVSETVVPARVEYHIEDVKKCDGSSKSLKKSK